MRRSLIALLMAPALVLAPRFVAAAEIPSGLEAVQAPALMDKSGVSAEEVRDLDAVEREELRNSDPSRQGGDGLVTVAIVLAIVALVYLYFQHVENMSR